MSPSSSVSMGTRQSNRTLEFGCQQVIRLLLEDKLLLEQFPVGDDPFTVIELLLLNV